MKPVGIAMSALPTIWLLILISSADLQRFAVSPTENLM